MAMGDKEELVMEDVYVRQSKHSKIFLGIISVLFCIIVCLLGLLIHFILDSKSCNSVCSTERCVQSAAVYLSNMNRSVDPCENFYEYSCGGWKTKHIIGEDETSVSAFGKLDDDVGIKCKAIFESAPGKNEPKAVSSVRNFYKSCVDLDAINKLDAQPVMDILADIGGWPVLGSNPGGNWQETSYDFVRLKTLISRKHGSGGILSVTIGADDKNTTRNVLIIDQPWLSLGDPEYYLDANKTKEKEAFMKYMIDIAVALGADSAAASEQMQEVMDFETAIASMLVPKSERRDSEKLYNVYTLQELRTAYPLISWDSYFNQLLNEEDTPLPDDERIINMSPDFLKNVTEWIGGQPKRVVANYLVGKVVSGYIGLLGQRFLDISQALINTLYGTTTSTARWKRCIGNVQAGTFVYATGRLYVAENFPATAKAKTLQMVNNLKEAFKSMLSTNDWMDEKDKKVAAEKADAMKVHIGYPDWMLNDTKLDDYYKGVLDMEADKYFENNMKYLKRDLDKYFASLRKPVEKDRFGSGPAVVNAFYNPTENVIVFPAGILQPPFYHHDLPWYSNYGGIGVVIGHEITHGFDDQGRQYDKVGNLETWWGNNSISKFKERAQCIVDQYSGFVMPETGEHLIGKQTQGENIADNGGLKESFKAFKDNAPPQPRLPGLDLTEEQMFFVSFAQVWCRISRPEAVSSSILSDPHSPGRFRAIGAPQNSKDFAKAFNCPVNSYMNPAKKCEVW
ncbi:neprilysin-1-like [Asterias amurensis]|uniref:neprilysin-1-like n=1 Tax=Asterias amurensis TaxID=7602 RepID=UPI003AB58485